jgi:hypothetical protein
MVGRVSPPSLPGLTRQSIFFVKRSCEGMAPRVKPACLAAPCRDGKSIRHHGTYKEDSEYEANDAAALNGGSFVALRDHPGPCPGPGWQLLAASGKRGVAGERGPQGDRGPSYRRCRQAGKRRHNDRLLDARPRRLLRYPNFERWHQWPATELARAV